MSKYEISGETARDLLDAKDQLKIVTARLDIAIEGLECVIDCSSVLYIADIVREALAKIKDRTETPSLDWVEDNIEECLDFADKNMKRTDYNKDAELRMSNLANEIVEGILKDLSGRLGIDDFFHGKENNVTETI